MTESRILWLALGVFVGYVIWGETKRRYPSGSMAQIIDVPDSGGFSVGTTPATTGTGTGANPGFASCGGTC